MTRASATGGERSSNTIDGRQVGLAVHLVIAELMREGRRQPTLQELLIVAAGSALMRKRVGSYRQAARQRLLTATSVYLRYFVPGPEWRFVGSEVAVPGARLDLVFEAVDGRVMADEIKTGRLSATEQAGFEEQIQRQLRGGGELYGTDFAGVRGLLLWAPSRSFIAHADGQRELLLEASIEGSKDAE